MKIIEILADSFFELLKTHGKSMWEIFAQMIDGEEKMIVFMDQNDRVLFHYTLPNSIEKLNEDQKIFAKEFLEKLQNK